MQLDTVAIAIVIFMNLTLGGFVLSRNFKNRINIIFAFLAFMIAVWAFSNYYTNYAPSSILLLANQGAFTTSLFMIYAVWLFSSNFPKPLNKASIQNFILYPLLIITAPLTLTKMVIADVSYRPSEQLTDITTGSAYFIFLITLVCFFIFIIKNFVYNYRTSNTVIRNQMKFMASGILIAFIWVSVTSAIIPAITGDWFIAKFGPVGSITLVGGIAYAIVKHRLFDIRLVVARTMAYVLLLSTIAVTYGLSIFALSRSIFVGSEITNTQQFVYIGLAVFISLTFQPLKKFFDRVTNRIFFRDAYDPEVALNELGKVLSEQVDLETIMHASLVLLAERMKLRQVRFVVFGESGEIYRRDSFGNTNDIYLRRDELAHFDSHNNKITVSDDLQSGKRASVMEKYDIDLVARLETIDGIVGYVLFGAKESGAIYSSQDFKLIDIASKQLAIAVQNARYFAQIAEFNATLQEKIKRATAKLEATNEKLKELDSAKDEFISMASHQLRTPLTSVKGYLSMVLEGDVGKLNKQQYEFVDQAFGSAQRMVYLIADLLNVSRLNTGKFVIDSGATNLAEVVRQEVDQLQRHAATRQITLTYKKPRDFPIVQLDETKIRQVIMNFTDNAIYYTPTGGKVIVELKKTPQSIELTVTDTGIGVPKALQHKLFTKFYRADNAMKARPDGTGLGLFMAKKVIIAQGGSIIFKSIEGKGSTFGFSFPIKKLLSKESKK